MVEIMHNIVLATYQINFVVQVLFMWNMVCKLRSCSKPYMFTSIKAFEDTWNAINLIRSQK
jgi:hypothetical protein